MCQRDICQNVTVDTPNSASLLETGSPSATPEPSSILLVGSGVLGFAVVLRRRLKT
jgi:hypothetical protein